jgi:cell division septation protein DedD
MRDLQHWKDKVELSLDGRQVFFLFFGGAVLACMLFALGVMTGRRLEARAIALDAPTTEDPLAALDQLGDLEDEELTYHRTLTKDRPRAKPGAAAQSMSSPPPVAAPTDEEHARPVKVVAPARSTPHAPANAIAAPVAEPSEAPAVAPARPAPRPAVAQNPLKGDNKEVATDAAQPRFSLQLSSFTAKRDADDFMHRVQTAGYRAFVVSSDVPGKGVMYRVRVGDFASKDAAMAMKGAVDNKLKISAILAKQ